ncbi:MAG: exodeoxyribonuclease V subunit alpha [Solirubrobacteraceae bacterium]
MSVGTPEADSFDVRRVRTVGETLLLEFNVAGVLAPADVHVASRLAALAGEDDESVALAAALAVRAPRLGHVHVDLSSIRETAAVDTEEAVDLSLLRWPDPAVWVARVGASPLVVLGEHSGGASAPFRLLGSRLYLDRYWADEVAVARDLRAMSDAADADVVLDVLADGLRRLFGDERGSRQGLAAGCAVLRRLAVLAGGPGTGKTTTAARIAALLLEQAVALGARPPLIALAAPTGKAAARLAEAVHQDASSLDAAPAIREQLAGLGASTLHRLLGWRPDSQSRFRHDRNQRLPHDIVIVDETSMVPLSLMARLIEALRPEARLVLVGDPGQLVSIEAGAVLGDIVGPAAGRLLMSEHARRLLEQVTGARVIASDPPGGVSIGDGIVVLDRIHRFGGGIAEIAAAVGHGEAQSVLDLLRSGLDDVTWLEFDVASAPREALDPVRAVAMQAARKVIEAARAGDARGALAALPAFRILCAHRRGPYGVAAWTAVVESWLEAELDSFAAEDRWYPGRPLLVTENDYELRLYNGDTGVAVASDAGTVTAAFEREGEIAHYSPMRLAAIDTVYAMTVHKSQGSQFEAAAVLLPDPSSRILTRELLYTAVTRARRRLIIAGTEAAIRLAVERPVARASGLRARLWE